MGKQVFNAADVSLVNDVTRQLIMLGVGDMSMLLDARLPTCSLH